jgi:hypothetical protein
MINNKNVIILFFLTMIYYDLQIINWKLNRKKIENKIIKN